MASDITKYRAALVVAASLIAAPLAPTDAAGAKASAAAKPRIEAAASHAHAAKPAKRKRGLRLPRGLRLLSPFPGQTGAVLHVRGEQVSPLPDEATVLRVTSESWTEVRGGLRQRGVIEDRLDGSRVESWSTPQLSVIRLAWPTQPSHPVPAPAGDLRCASTAALASDAAEAEIAMVRAAQARVQAGEALPAGPQVDGQPTVIVDAGELRSASGAAVAGSTQRLALDPATGRLRQRIVQWPGYPASTTTYELWEVRPAGGTDADLGRPFPPNTRLNPAPDCELTERWVRGEF